MDFLTLPGEQYTLRNVSVPACFTQQSGDLLRTDIGICKGKISDPGGIDIDMSGAMVLPAFVDMHTHLDKGHILPRASNPNGTFPGALNSVRADHANWSATDVYRRADFALRCAFAHGTQAIRTHLDSLDPQDTISWPVFAQLRQEWQGKIDLQAACLTGCDVVDLNGRFLETAKLVQHHAGVLGIVVYPMEGLDNFLTSFLELAAELNLPVDFHVDETMDPTVECLRKICQAVIKTGFAAPVTVGHCCSLSAQDKRRAFDTLDLVAKARINVVSLPMCNLYLQDRQHGVTPRLRGVTLVHEMKQRGIPISFASDNTRDPFYAYGDLDMMEVLRESTRIAHLDHSDNDWIEAYTTTPALVCGFNQPTLNKGESADLILFNARNYTELLARPQADRIVIRSGEVINRKLPDYAELDDLFH
jgi:cytosine/creatinine deaminase